MSRRTRGFSVPSISAVSGPAMAAFLGLLVAVLAPAQEAHAVTDPGIRTGVGRLVEVASVQPGASQQVGGPVVDSSAERAYVIDRAHNAVQEYDVSGDEFVSLTEITAGLDTPVALAIDEANHRLYVGEGMLGTLEIVDIDPASPRRGTVIRTVDTGGRNATAIGVADGNTVFVANDDTSDVSVIDLATGDHTTVPISGGVADLVVDAGSGRAYVADTTRSSITTISGTVAAGPTVTTVVTGRAPRELALTGDRLLAVTETSPGVPEFALETVDPVTGALSARSAPLAGQPTDLAVDPAAGTAYLAFAAFGRPGLQILDTATMAPLATAAAGRFLGSVAVDPATSRVYTAETFAVAGARVTMYDSPRVIRVGGTDRYAVSAAISQRSFPAGLPIAYVASGEQFPDALAGSAAAGAQRAPVLLVRKSVIPAAVADELSRLVPSRIIVLGGPATIDDSVLAALGDYSRTVTRIGGADRYEVAAAVSGAIFGAGPAVAYLASGENFPDALAGAAAAGHLGGPVLLTRSTTVPEAALAELRRLAPGRIVVLGGPQTVGQSVLDAVAGIAPVTRQSGADRYATAAAVSAATYPTAPHTVYVASGAVFPDALSASAAAATAGGPVLLVSPEGIPAAVDTELRRIRPITIVVLGGPATVSDATVAALSAYLAE